MSELGDLHGAITKCNSKSQSSDIYTHRLESSAILNESIHLGYLTKNFIFYLLNFYFLLLIKFFFYFFIIFFFINGCDWNTTIISTIKSNGIIRNYSLYYMPIYMHKKPNIREREREREQAKIARRTLRERTSQPQVQNVSTQ